MGEATGLGLSMVYGLMKRQQGAVRLSSAEGEGTTVEDPVAPVVSDMVMPELGGMDLMTECRERGAQELLGAVKTVLEEARPERSEGQMRAPRAKPVVRSNGRDTSETPH